MRTTTILMISAAGLLIAGALALDPAPAQESRKTIERIELDRMTLEELAAFPGVSNAMLVGSFDQEGLYTSQALLRQGSTFPPHTHPDIRLTVVTSGTMYLGEGEVFDEAALVAYPAGSVAITPAGTPHFMAAPDGDMRALEIGSGPTASDFTAAE